MKKKLAMLIAPMLVMTTAMGTATVHAENVPVVSVEEKIVMEAMGFSSIPSDFKYILVSVDSGVSAYSTDENTGTAKAIKTEKDLGNGIIEISYTYPYIETEDGLENSFAYAARSVSEDNWSIPFTDMTITAAAGYQVIIGPYVDMDPALSRRYYRIYYGAASWRKTDSSSSAAVDSFYVVSAVDATKYSSSTFEEIGKYNNRIGRTYNSPVQNNRCTTAYLMPTTSSFLVADSDPGEYGGVIVDFTYHTSNGTTRSDSANHPVFNREGGIG